MRFNLSDADLFGVYGDRGGSGSIPAPLVVVHAAGTGRNGPTDPDDLPPGGAGALRVHAPKGRYQPLPGYQVYAIRTEMEPATDGDGCEVRDADGRPLMEEVVVDGCGIGDRFERGATAQAAAAGYALQPAMLPRWANAVVVNDGAGRELFRRPVLRAA